MCSFSEATCSLTCLSKAATDPYKCYKTPGISPNVDRLCPSPSLPSQSAPPAAVETRSYNGKSPPNCCWPAGMRVWEAKQNWLPPKTSPVCSRAAAGRKMAIILQLVSALWKLRHAHFFSFFLRQYFYAAQLQGCQFMIMMGHFADYCAKVTLVVVVFLQKKKAYCAHFASLFAKITFIFIDR